MEKQFFKIKIQVPNTNWQRMKTICDRFDCTVTRGNTESEIYTIQSDDPMNFYWLGLNMAEKLQYPNGRSIDEIIQK